MPRGRKKNPSYQEDMNVSAGTLQIQTDDRIVSLETNMTEILDFIRTQKQSVPTEAEHVAPQSQPGACSTPSGQHKQRSRSTPPNRHDDIATHTRRRRLPSPDELCDTDVQRNEDQAALRDMYPRISPLPGKVTKHKDKRDKHPQPKDFLPRRLAIKAKDPSYDLSIPEHIMGLARMALDETDHQASRDIVTHMSQVAEDAISHPWGAVLDWSNTMVDMVGEGGIHWGDKLGVQSERMKLAWSVPMPPHVHLTYPCHDWNRGTCGEKASPHKSTVNDLSLSHICALCWNIKEDRNTHQARNCFIARQGTNAPV